MLIRLHLPESLENRHHSRHQFNSCLGPPGVGMRTDNFVVGPQLPTCLGLPLGFFCVYVCLLWSFVLLLLFLRQKYHHIASTSLELNIQLKLVSNLQRSVCARIKCINHHTQLGPPLVCCCVHQDSRHCSVSVSNPP